MGSLETSVLEQLWTHRDGATPAEVHDALADLAYTTVMTILTRLWKKGRVDRTPRGRTFVYRAVVTEAELVAERMEHALDQTRNRRAALSHFVTGLSAKDEKLLRSLLEER
jgi:predicted transcriptional regulator